MQSNDFEVLPIGTKQELELYRDLFYIIQRNMKQWGAGIVPHEISTQYNKICKHYEKHNVILDRTA